MSKLSNEKVDHLHADGRIDYLIQQLGYSLSALPVMMCMQKSHDWFKFIAAVRACRIIA